jgi:hypothetical protein
MSTVGRKFTTNRWLHGFTTAFLMRDVMKISMDFTAGMPERRKQLRRTWQPQAIYPYPCSEGNWVTRNRRIVVDQRAHNAEQKAPPRDTHKMHVRFYENVKEISLETQLH